MVDDVGVSKAKPGLEAAEFGFWHLYIQQLPVAVECAFQSVRSSNGCPHSHGTIVMGMQLSTWPDRGE